ncbi:MAG: hypothetical protein ABF291_07500 [Desulfobacterales bacterium]
MGQLRSVGISSYHERSRSSNFSGCVDWKQLVAESRLCYGDADYNAGYTHL